MPPHPLSRFERQKYYQNEPKYNGVYSRNTLYKVIDGAYVINIDQFKSIGTPKEIRKFIRNNNVKQIFIEYKHVIL